ncbi:MAG: sigma-54-dependent Fis family transcriptional regulator [Flavobacteriales bacterium]|nr:sigma-54-dependent Fis family transcriptional regulator [Flavobacteriales bacterium]
MRNPKLKIFVVEDDKWYRNMLEHTLALNPDYEIVKFVNGQDLLDNLQEKPDIITLDYHLPDIHGDKLLKKIFEYDPDIKVIIVSCQDDIETAVSLLKEGAYDYVVKNGDTRNRLLHVVNSIRENGKRIHKNSEIKKEEAKETDFSKIIIGESSALKEMFFLIEKAVNTNITVSITGETGTGKELVAKATHFNSNRRKHPFVPVNVSAIPRELIESELFGHEKGAFTGANNKRIGKFEEAHKGTIFLDEIGEMDINLQTKLLRVLQEKEFTRVGGNEVIKVDTRVIVATNKNFAEEIKKGNFRQDLYYRLLGLPIYLPTLRERGKDIILLAKHFMNVFCRENNMKELTLSAEAKSKLLKYSFPGNVRELKAVIELAAVLCDTESIDADDINLNHIDPITDLLIEDLTLKEYTHKIIRHYLNKYNDNAMEVAAKLDVGKSTIYRMLKNGQEEYTINGES